MAARAALAVIDMQEDFCEPNGSLALPGGREIAPVINQLLDLPGFALKFGTRDFHPANHISFASQHVGAAAFTSKATIQNPDNTGETQTTTLWPDHCVQGTPGCELIPEIHKHKLARVIDKGMDVRVESYSGFGPPFRSPRVAMTDLDDYLKEHAITHLFVVGLAYDVCVFHTAIDAVEHGYKTFVIQEATRAAAQTEEGLAATKKSLESKGVAVIDVNSKELDIAKQA